MNKPLFFWGILLLSALSLQAKTITIVAPSLDADFKADATEICAGDSVHFIDLTTENPTGWSWTFDGGSPDESTLQNPVIAYNTPGVYTVRLKANNGDEGDEEDKIEYIKVLSTPSSTFNVTSATGQCNNSNSFSFANTGSSGTHFWGFPGGSPINSSAVNPSGIVFTGPGTHDVSHKVTDGGCSSTTIVSITIFSSPTALAVTSTASNCAGPTGTITIGATTNGTAPFTYSVNGSSFSSTTSYTGFAPGTYSVTVKDAHGCTFTRTITVGSFGGPTSASVTITPSTCGNANGLLTINSVTGGAAPYLYAMDNGALGTSTSFSGLSAGTHQVKVKDANGCQLTQNVTVTNTQPTSVVTNTTPSACATANGTLTLGAVTGGRSPYTFSVDGGSFSSSTNYTGLAAGTHTIVVKDVTGCTLTTTITITNTPGPTAFASTTTLSACATANGSINAQTPVGGTAPFTYSFNGGGFTSTHLFTGLAAGTYTVVAKDANGCTISQTINLGNTPAPTAIAITTNASACSASTGTLTLGAVTGGTAPYTFSVDASAFTSTTNYTGLTSGTHAVVVKDANGCTFTTSATIANTQPTAASITTTSSSCTSTGSITIGAVTGGVNPFVYSVNNSSFTSTTVYNNRPAGTYTVSVKDFNGCILTQTVTIGSTAPTAVALSATTTTCGASTGTVTIGAVTGGVSPFTYSFNGGAFTGTTNYTALAAGVYTVTAKDANGCTVAASISVVSDAGPTGVSVTNTGTTCSTANGTITIGTVTGGTPPFTFAIDNGAFTATTTYTNVASGTHTVRVKDATGCIFPVSTTLINAPGPTDVSLTSTNATCGTANGTITVGAVTGGTAPFTYSLDNGAFTSTTNYTGLGAGTHQVTVKDANGCTFTKSRTLSISTGPTALALTSQNTGCTSLPNTGGITVTGVTGGVPPYTYSLNGGAFISGQGFIQLTAGTYTVTVKDANGCTFSSTATVANVPHGPQSFTSSNVNPGCGQSDGSVTVTSVTNGTAPFTYELTNGLMTIPFSSSPVFTGLAAGFYNLRVKDASGCVTTFGSPTLASTGGPTAMSFTPTSATCGQPNGSLSITSVTGGVAPYQYSLNNSAFTGSTTYTGITGGVMMPLTVKDANGCTFTTYALVNNDGFTPGPPVITQSGFLLTATTSNAYQWFFNGVAIPGSTNQTHFAQFNGSYTCKRIEGSCSSAPSNTIVITNQTQRLAEHSGPVEETDAVRNDEQREQGPSAIENGGGAGTLVAFPNPNDGMFTLAFDASENTTYTIEVFNIFGQVVFTEEVSHFSGTYSKQLDLSEFGAGIYTVVLSDPETRTVQKIVTH